MRNPSRCLFKITSRKIWQVYLDHAGNVPVPNLCCRYHLKGVCNKSCFFRLLHVPLTGDQTAALGKWVESCRARMPRQPADAAKKPKLVGNSDIAYTDLPLNLRWTPTNESVARVHSNLLERSAAARLHVSTRGLSSTHALQAQLDPATLVTTRHFERRGSLDAHAIAGALIVRPQGALSFPRPLSGGLAHRRFTLPAPR